MSLYSPHLNDWPNRRDEGEHTKASHQAYCRQVDERKVEGQANHHDHLTRIDEMMTSMVFYHMLCKIQKLQLSGRQAEVEACEGERNAVFHRARPIHRRSDPPKDAHP